MSLVTLGVLLIAIAAPQGPRPPGRAVDPNAPRLVVQTGQVGSYRVSPNGKQIAANAGDGPTVRVWDLETGRELRQLRSGKPVYAFAYSPDGRRIVTDGEDDVLLWDSETGLQLRKLRRCPTAFLPSAFSSDGKRVLTAGAGDAVAVTDADTGVGLIKLGGRPGSVWWASFTSDGKRIVTAGADKVVRVWDAESGEELHKLASGASLTSPFAPLPVLTADGKRIVTTLPEEANPKVQVWDVETGKLHCTLEGHTAKVHATVVSPDGKRIATAGADQTLRIWDAETGKLAVTVAKPALALGFGTLAVSPDGTRLVGAATDRVARVWDLKTGRELMSLGTEPPWWTTACFISNGTRILTVSDGRASVWHAVTGKELMVLESHAEPYWTPRSAFTPDGKRFVWRSRTAQVWDLEIGREIGGLSVGSDRRFESVSPDGRFALMLREKTASVWDVARDREISRLEGHVGGPTVASFSWAGDRVAGCEHPNKSVRVWDVVTGKELLRLERQAGRPFGVTYSPDGKRLVVRCAPELALTLPEPGKEKEEDRGANKPDVLAWDEVWDAETGKQLLKLTARGDVTRLRHVETDGTVTWSEVGMQTIQTEVAFAPDGKRFVIAGGLAARVVDAGTGREVRLEGHPEWVNAVTFSPDGKQVVTGSDGTARFWNAETGERLQEFVGLSARINSLAFSPDGKWLFVGSEDGTTVWDVKARKELCRFVSFKDGSWAVVDASGRYDASDPSRVAGMHWVVRSEPIALEQFRRDYHDPGLLAKHLGFNTIPLLTCEGGVTVRLNPDVTFTPPAGTGTAATLTLTNRGGGIGSVRVSVNGNELPLTARRGAAPDPTAKSAAVEFDLAESVALLPGKVNEITVVTSNADRTLRGRGMKFEWTAPGDAEEYEPQLFAVVCGISEYADKGLNLRYAAKDAEDFAAALRVAGERLFGKDKVHITLLTTSGAEGALSPTRENLEKAFAGVSKARPDTDVLVVYLAGHGATTRTGAKRDDLVYCYATRDATSITPSDLAAASYRERVAVTSEDLRRWIQKYVPAKRQVLILDTCAAGAAAVKLTDKRDVPADQRAALLDLKERTGVFLLMGCSADRVSYESTEYAQGLLTYSLLFGMQGASLKKRTEGEFVDVLTLFRDAADRVPRLAGAAGGVQTPLVSVGEGGSFDIGRLTDEDKRKIRLAARKPLILRPRLVNTDDPDDDKLEKLLERGLREASTPAARGAEPALVYVPAADELPGAVRVSGSYAVTGDKVQGTLTLKRDGKEVKKIPFEGKSGELPQLVGELVEKVTASVRS